MIIYSWNMLFRNRELDRAFNFIQNAEFEVFCIQEVPENFLTRLQTLTLYISFRSERDVLVRTERVPNYLVILSKHPIENHREIPAAEYEMLLPLRSRLFIRFMPTFYFSIRGTSGIYADIRLPGEAAALRVFNMHLPLNHPSGRIREFEVAMAERDPARPAIVCGDFNTLEAPHITLLNWLLGGALADAVRYKRERTHINRRFVEHSLANAFAGRSTHPFSRSQLDHILISHAYSIKSAEVLPDRFGSDHHPIRVEITR